MFCIGQAANILEISEYEVLRRAYTEQFGGLDGAAVVEHVFAAYLAGSEAPFWARRYAWRVIREFEDHRHVGPVGLVMLVAGLLPAPFPEECSLRL
jgi:hypothetical protein